MRRHEKKIRETILKVVLLQKRVVTRDDLDSFLVSQNNNKIISKKIELTLTFNRQN